jgi:hypothetical protein
VVVLPIGRARRTDLSAGPAIKAFKDPYQPQC